MLEAYDLWAMDDARKERWLESLPICSECGEPIQDDMLYDFDGTLICQDCMREHLHATDNYM